MLKSFVQYLSRCRSQQSNYSTWYKYTLEGRILLSSAITWRQGIPLICKCIAFRSMRFRSTQHKAFLRVRSHDVKNYQPYKRWSLDNVEGECANNDQHNRPSIKFQEKVINRCGNHCGRRLTGGIWSQLWHVCGKKKWIWQGNCYNHWVASLIFVQVEPWHLFIIQSRDIFPSFRAVTWDLTCLYFFKCLASVSSLPIRFLSWERFLLLLLL